MGLKKKGKIKSPKEQQQGINKILAQIFLCKGFA